MLTGAQELAPRHPRPFSGHFVIYCSLSRPINCDSISEARSLSSSPNDMETSSLNRSALKLLGAPWLQVLPEPLTKPG